MPSIELVCINQTAPIAFNDFSFAVISKAALISHREPRPLFQRELSQMAGCIYHIGNPSCRDSSRAGYYFAFEVLSEKSRESLRNRFFEVGSAFRVEFQAMMSALIKASPAHSVFFYSDWQFGPKRATRGGRISEARFWQAHDLHQLKLNACYTIY